MTSTLKPVDLDDVVKGMNAAGVDPAGHYARELVIVSDVELTALADRQVTGAGSLDTVTALPPYVYGTGAYVDLDFAAAYADNVAAVIRCQHYGNGTGVVVAPDLDAGALALDHLADRGLGQRPAIGTRTYRFDNADTYGRCLMAAVREYAHATTYTTKN